MTRIIRWTATVLLLATLFGTSLTGNVRAQDDAQAQLDATAATMLALNSFHFDLETTAGKTSFQNLFELKSVTGDVVRPNSFQAQVNLQIAMLAPTLEVVGIGGDIWVKNPLGGSDAFVQLTGGDTGIQLPPAILLNPDQLVSQALAYLENPQLAGKDKLDGQEMTVVTGTFDPARLTGNVSSSEMGQFEAAKEPLEVKAWIDDQDRLVRIDFIGPLFAFEEGTGRLVRSITFSNFDADITIQQPA